MSKIEERIARLRRELEKKLDRERSLFEHIEELSLEQVPFWVVDVETTGANPEQDRVIEVAAIKVQQGQMQRVISTLVNPGKPVPAFIQNLTGITNQMLRGAPLPEEVYPWLFSHLKRGVFVAHYASFDRGFVDQEARRLGISPLTLPSLCTVRLSRRLIFDLQGYSLDDLAWYFGLEFGRASSPRSRHRALGDAWVCARAFLSLLELAKKIGISRFGELKKLESMPIKRARQIWKR